MQTLRFEPCHVSLAAHRVLKTVHDAFKQASGATPEMAHILYQSGRDALELFLAIVPIKFADIIETVPHMGAVFYNDCCYIAHNTTLITHAYRKSFAAVDETFQNCVGLMDFVPRFRSLGESKLGKHLDEQKQTLNELVLRINIRTDEESGMTSNNSGDQNMTSGLSVEKDSMAKAVSALTSLPPTSTRAIALTESLRFMDSLSVVGGLRKVVTSVAAAAAGAVFDDGDSAVSSNYTSASKRQYGSHDENFNNEESAAMVIKHIERVSTQWKGVLQQSVYERVVGHLVEYTLRAIMKPVLTADCISETSGAEISRVMKVTLAVSKVFSETDQVGSNNKSVTNKAAAAAEQKCQQVCASWKKFGALSDLLEYSLSEIADQLPLRKFSAFTGHEMCRLIKALFEDTPRRQTILNSIMDMAS